MRYYLRDNNLDPEPLSIKSWNKRLNIVITVECYFKFVITVCLVCPLLFLIFSIIIDECLLKYCMSYNFLLYLLKQEVLIDKNIFLFLWGLFNGSNYIKLPISSFHSVSVLKFHSLKLYICIYIILYIQYCHSHIQHEYVNSGGDYI